MTPEERQSMKEQLKQEILADLAVREEIKREIIADLASRTAPKPYMAVSKEFNRRTEFLGPQKQYWLKNAFSLVIRFRFKLNGISQLSEEQAEEAQALLPEFLSIAGCLET